MSRRHSRSSATAKCATPLFALCAMAPPSASLVTSSCVTVLMHVRAGHEHVARALDHDGEVGDRRRVHGAAGARPHDRGDLRHDAGRQRVAQEDVGVAAERQHAFLNARAARVVQADDRRAHLHRQIHDLDDLRGVGLGERSAEDGEVLRERVDGRPSTRPWPETTPSPGTSSSAMPKSRQRCVTSLSSSSKVPGSNSRSIALARGQLAGLVLAAAARPRRRRARPGARARARRSRRDRIRPGPPAPSPSPSGTSRARCR